jgi:hypothetical protein
MAGDGEPACSNALGGATGSGGSGATGGSTGTGGATSTGGTPATCDPTVPSSGTYYVAASDGSGSTCPASAPCSATTAIGMLQAGQTAYLRGGTYSGLNVSKVLTLLHDPTLLSLAALAAGTP